MEDVIVSCLETELITCSRLRRSKLGFLRTSMAARRDALIGRRVDWPLSEIRPGQERDLWLEVKPPQCSRAARTGSPDRPPGSPGGQHGSPADRCLPNFVLISQVIACELLIRETLYVYSVAWKFTSCVHLHCKLPSGDLDLLDLLQSATRSRCSRKPPHLCIGHDKWDTEFFKPRNET